MRYTLAFGVIFYLGYFVLLVGCGAREVSSPQMTIELFQQGIKAKDRQIVGTLIFDKVETIAPEYNNSWSNTEFLDRIFSQSSYLVRFSLSVDAVKISGNRASVQVTEVSEIRLAEEIRTTGGTYTYEMIKTGSGWKIFRITKGL